MKQVFISYSEEDSEVARGLAGELRKFGVITWTYEENGLAGFSYLEQVHAAIRDSHAFILLASASSLKSHNVIREAETAYESQKLIIPVRLDISPGDLAKRAIFRMVSGTAVSIPATLSSLGSVAARINASLQRVADDESIPPSGEVKAVQTIKTVQTASSLPPEEANAPSDQTTRKQTSTATAVEQVGISRMALAICVVVWGAGLAWIGLFEFQLAEKRQSLFGVLAMLREIADPVHPEENTRRAIRDVEGMLRSLPFWMIGFGLMLLAGLWILFRMLRMGGSSLDVSEARDPIRVLRSSSSVVVSDVRRLLTAQLITWALIVVMMTVYGLTAPVALGVLIDPDNALRDVVRLTFLLPLSWLVLWQITRRSIGAVQMHRRVM